MKIKCHRQPLMKALQSINAVATVRDANPILANVRISALHSKLVLKATDLKIALTYIVPQDAVEISEEGELLIPAFRLYSLVKEISDGDIVIQSKELNGFVACEDGQFLIQGEEINKFPEVADFQDQGSLEISGEDFQKLIKKTLFATTVEKARYDLDNILGVIKGDKICFVATDGKRLALCEKKCQVLGEELNIQFTVPCKGVQQIEKILNATTPDTVRLSVLANQLLFRTSDVVLSTRLSDGKFPPYEKVIPKNLPFRASFAHKNFASALRRVCQFADEKNKIVELSFSSNKIKFYSIGVGTGEATVEIPVDFQGESINIKFNPNFLLDVLKIVDNPNTEICLQSGQAAVLLKDGDDFQYVILPIKLEENAV